MMMFFQFSWCPSSMFYAFTADVFSPDGGDMLLTKEHIETLGWKATPLTRSIVFVLALSMSIFALWKMFQPSAS